MGLMNVNIELLPGGIMPTYATDGSAGLDCYTQWDEQVWWGDVSEIDLGFKIEIPTGHVGLLYIRSGLSKKQLRLVNSVGVIDSDYRGEMKCLMTSDDPDYEWDSFDISQGERVCQLVIMPYPKVFLNQVKTLTTVTDRGEGGFGSTGTY
jgi:dUTP pyrophosphatase